MRCRSCLFAQPLHKDASPTEAGDSSRMLPWRLVISRALWGKKEGGLGLVSTTPLPSSAACLRVPPITLVASQLHRFVVWGARALVRRARDEGERKPLAGPESAPCPGLGERV